MNSLKQKINEELGYDSDLVKDSADEERLEKLPEIDREKEIFERRQKRDQLVQRYQLLKQRQAQMI